MDQRTNRRAVIGRVRFEGRAIGSRTRASGLRQSRPTCDMLEGRQLLSTTAAATTVAADAGTPQPPAQFSPFDGQSRQDAPGFGGDFGGHVGHRGLGMGGGFGRSMAPDFSQAGPSQATSATVGTTGAPASRSVPTGFFGVRGGAFGGMRFSGSIAGGQGDVFWGQAARSATTTTNADGTTTTTSTTTTSANADALKADFDKLHADLQAIQDKSQVTPALLAAVRNDIQSIMKASTASPKADLVDAVARDLAALGRHPDFTSGTLQSDLEAAIKSTGVTDTALISTLETDLNAVYKARGITADDVARIQADADQIKADSGSTSTDDMLVASLSELPGIPHLSDLLGAACKPATPTAATDVTGTASQAPTGAFDFGGGPGMGRGMGRHFGGPMGF
ncbi:MAG: hypothetical protein U0800_21835 [Isosphaeraceae bacterium]